MTVTGRTSAQAVPVCVRVLTAPPTLYIKSRCGLNTHPDITFAVSTLSQFLDNLREVHWEAVKRVYCYLSGTRDLVLTYGEDKHELRGHTDADGASQEHRHAISGYCYSIDGGAVAWSSKKQELVTLSTAEAEYVAVTHASKEAIWLRCLIGNLVSHSDNSTTLLCDN